MGYMDKLDYDVVLPTLIILSLLKDMDMEKVSLAVMAGALFCVRDGVSAVVVAGSVGYMMCWRPSADSTSIKSKQRMEPAKLAVSNDSSLEHSVSSVSFIETDDSESETVSRGRTSL